ncbi:MAG: ABC transporter substrate-binding protein [Spirochaetaceae bacterium]|jgi:branched-chain amino acid transport system substrate-binding protein|nr:ABC transporter substrate-binding protein [Spirochaetaceae bacterium]
MKRYAAVAPVLLALALAGCARSGGDVIRIGYVGALSGETSLWGQTGLNGLYLTADKINASGGVLGKQIEIVGLDGKGEPQDSVNALNRLIDEYHVVAVVGTNFSSCNIPMAAVADRKQVPIIGTAASNELVTVDENGNLHPYSFRMCFIDSFLGTKMGEYVLSLGLKRAAFLVNQSEAYSVNVAGYTVDAVTAGGGEVVAQEAAGGADTQFEPQLTRIGRARPDVLFLPWTNPNTIGNIAKQARKLGLTFRIYGYDGWDSMELPTLAEGALEGQRFGSRIGFNTPEARAYGEEYQARFNMALEAECLFTNDALLWIVQAINEAGSADPVAIRDRLEATTYFSGLLGAMSVDPATHNPSRELAIFEIQGPDEVFLEIFN